MILLHRIRGEAFHLNVDLIETIEHLGDTVLTLSDGRHLVVLEEPGKIVDAIRTYRASIIAAATVLQADGAPSLFAIPGGRDDD